MTTNLNSEMVIEPAHIEKAGWQELARKAGLFLLFLLCALAVFVLGSNYYTIFPTNKNISYEVGTTAFFLIAALLLRSQPRFRNYWPVAYAFFVASAVIVVTSLTMNLRDSLFQSIGVLGDPNRVGAFAKIFEAVLTITTVLLLSRLAGFCPDSLYVRRGNLRWGLILGIGVLVNFAASSLMFFSGRFSGIEALGSAILWGMVFSLANGFLEELWLRGLFLRNLIPLLGPGAAIVLTSLRWSLFHVGAVYFQPYAIPFFLANLLTFGLAYGPWWRDQAYYDQGGWRGTWTRSMA